MTFVRPVQHGTWQLATPTLPHDTALMPRSLRGDFLSVNCGREQLVPAEGHAVLRGSRVCAFAQAYGCTAPPRSMWSARQCRHRLPALHLSRGDCRVCRQVDHDHQPIASVNTIVPAAKRYWPCHYRPHFEAGLHGLRIDLMHRGFCLPAARPARRSTSIALDSGAPSRPGEKRTL
jgi:hypothetical protein